MSYLKDFIPANYLIYKGKSEASAEAEAILPDYYPPDMRIIRTEAVPFIRSKTVYGEKLAVEGNVEFRVLYQSDKGDFNSFFYKAPFSHAIEIQNLQDASFAVDSNIEYKDIRALSPQKLSLRASVSLSAYAVRSENKEILSEDRETSGDVAVLSSEETFCREINRVSKLVRHSGDISLEGKTPVDKILRYEIGFSNTEFKPLNKKTLIKSDMTMKILCINAESKKPILIEEKTVVSQLLDVDTVDDDSVAIISPKVADIRFDLKENSEGKVSGIEYNAEIDVTFSVFREQKFNVISDAFGVGKEIELGTEKVMSEKLSVQNQPILFEETVDIGQFSEICDVSVTPVLSDTRFDKESHVSEANGEFIVNVLFTDSDGELLSSEKKIPFSLRNETGASCSGVRQEIDVSLRDLSYDISDGKINCKIDCLISGIVFVAEEKEVITSLSETDAEGETDDSHLVLYYARKGERLWDIAKKYRTLPETILSANNLSENVLEEEKMLFITRYV